MSKLSDKSNKFFIELQLFVFGATFYWDTVYFIKHIPICAVNNTS